MSGGEMDQPIINDPEGEAKGSQSFQMPSDLTPPEPMGGSSTNGSPSPAGKQVSPPAPAQAGKPLETKPPKTVGPYIIITVLILILIAGTVFFSAWRGWIKIDGLFQESTPAPSIVISPKISPKISTSSSVSPSVSPSSQIDTNINDETRKKDLADLKLALKEYFLANSGYPTSNSVIKTSDSANVLTQALVPSYMEKLPDDPLAPKNYYGYKSDGTSFEITAVLEDKSDSSGTISGNLNIYKVTNTSEE